MPHQCTQCGHTFPDGSKEMLSGCPDCGGNKFQFKPTADARESGPSDPSPAGESVSNPGSTPNTVATTDDASTEDRAQADARREVVAGDELADESAGEESDDGSEPEPDADSGPGVEAESADEPEAGSESGDSNMAALRRELDDQFESIKILEPGQYELNLMELYNREEYIIALQEDGQYVIEVPDSWLGNDDE